MTWKSVLDLVFPAQCVGCNALGAGLCESCAPSATPIDVRLRTLPVTALAPYEGALRGAILALKDGRRDVAEALGAAIAPLVERGALLVPVPTTAKRRRTRGVDGVALVAQTAARLAGARAVAALTQRAGDAQRGRSREQRLSARGRFHCDAAAVAGRVVTLIDDVCTTGATLDDCAAAVREAGGIAQGAVVVAVTKSGRPWNQPKRG